MFGWGCGRAVALREIAVLALAVGAALAPAAVSAAPGTTGPSAHISTATTPSGQSGQGKAVAVHTPVARGRTPAASPAVTVSPVAATGVPGTAAAVPATGQPATPRVTVRVHGVDAGPAAALSVEATGPGGAVQAARNADAGLSARSWSVREAGAAVVALGTLPLVGALATARRPRRRFA